VLFVRLTRAVGGREAAKVGEAEEAMAAALV